jgi:hypothetical protein
MQQNASRKRENKRVSRELITGECKDYQYITISIERLDTLPINSDISLSLLAVINDNTVEEEPQPILH